MKILIVELNFLVQSKAMITKTGTTSSTSALTLPDSHPSQSWYFFLNLGNTVKAHKLRMFREKAKLTSSPGGPLG